MGTGYNRPNHNPNLTIRDHGELLGGSIVQGDKLGRSPTHPPTHVSSTHPPHPIFLLLTYLPTHPPTFFSTQATWCCSEKTCWTLLVLLL